MSSDGLPFRSRRLLLPQCKLRLEWLLLLLQILALHSRFASGSGRRWDEGVITEADYQGLQAIKSAFADPTGVLRSWNTTGAGACSGGWAGIRCLQGQVVAIQLPWRALGGRISESIGQLTALRRLSLHDNYIGGQVPYSLGFLPNLRGVYLFNNRFSGSIPPSVGNCLQLQTLDVSRNFITGSIPESIANSTNLHRLNLSYNSLQGSIPVSLTRSMSLVFLSLEHNNLSGPVPDDWGVGGAWDETSTAGHRLRILNLDHNSLSGRIPTSLSKLTMLQVISLSNNNLTGSIPDELGQLRSLQTFDLSGNSINGSFPTSLCNLSSLVYLNLANNRLRNEIPPMIDGLKNLTFLSLKQNQFHGQIPPALGNVTTLSSLDLSGNKFAGEIPVSLVQLSHLGYFDVSDNNLSGPVPLTLAAAFSSSSFRGNVALCGYNVAVPCSSSSSSPATSSTTSSSSPIILLPTLEPPAPRGTKLSTKEIILITSGCVLVFLLLLCSVLLCFLMKNRAAASGKKSATASVAAGAAARGEKPCPGALKEAESAGGKLVLLDEAFAFTADDLLCATAEIMGKSAFGTVYKATLADGNQVAVKRLREKIVKPHKEFEAEADVIGRIRHPNLLAMRAYYMGPKGEKLLVFDYMPKGSLAAFLHARGPDTAVDWRTRARIALGAAKGLSHLHSLSLPVVHGSLTSTTILLDGDAAPKLTDFALSRLTTTVNPTPATSSSSYRAPELVKSKKPTVTSDVYSLGVVILELLTGKSPAEDGVELPTWVASVVEEEWANEVLDVELVGNLNGKKEREEIMNALKLALHCVDPDPKARPEAAEVVKQLEEIMPELAAEEVRTSSPVKGVEEGVGTKDSNT